ncbi:hypothetical protein QAD02_006446 [Eretmocerus hayati]|uniref:Uncharacterized protein n=1 Tax=Eretmocerus hayati TaxID=131215 RepID=A0ACC2N179_9HYME|nr:hypothetical protein QAD02_006446 [Eretmocerus hayati]
MDELKEGRGSCCSSRRGMRRKRYCSFGVWLISLLTLGSSFSCIECLSECALGIKTPGRTWPAGDIVLEYGKPLRILCLLNETYLASSPLRGKNSSDLVFFKNYRQIDSEYITVLNESAIQLDIDKPPPEDATYYCKLRLEPGQQDKDFEGVCLNKVVVGFKPEQPLEFDCVSQNWENLTCSWQPPPNFVDTSYIISFKLPGRAGGRMVLPCPSEQKGKSRNSCFWDFTTNPIYRQPYEYYTFFLQGENVLGNWSGSYKFHHFANVIPARPTNLTVVNKTTNSALLHWSVSFPMQNFPAGLHHKVEHQNQWDRRDAWKVIQITDDIHTAKRYFNLTELRYANAIYDVRVFIKSAAAVGEDKWSNFSDITFRTLPTVPGQAPRTDVGSFQIDGLQNNREVYLYWQTIPDYLENGEGFAYVVSLVEENGRRLYLEPSEITRSYAKFRGLSYTSSYKFEIVASNEVGVLEQPATIFVPSLQTIPKEPTAFTKIAFDDGLYELSWKPPVVGSKDITDYTIFWCQNDRDWPYQCSGYLDWVHVSKSTRMHNITVPDPTKVYQFAISANTARGSSGMMWASCTVIHNKVEGKMRSVWRNNFDATSIEVGWKLDCSDRIGFVEGFKIYYCPIVSPHNSTCREPKLNTTIKADLNTIRGTITGLKPYTTYMISVAVLTKSGESQQSDPLFVTTLEGPPSYPYDVIISDVTNSTMYIEWKRPVEKNGVINEYEVYYNNVKKIVNEIEGSEPNVTLTGLIPHEEYEIRVAACTVKCSEKSEPVYASTKIGVPGEIQSPGFTFVNSSQVKVTWHRPLLSAGNLDYYQIKDSDGKIQNTTANFTYISIPDCKADGAERLYRFHVRAVNIAPNNEHLFGNWSDTGESNCYSTGPSYRVWVVIWVIGSICGIAFVFCVAYSSKRIWMKCKAMQDVEVKLPPGLAPNMKLLQKSGEQHQRQSSADSSGCSSGQESVTSSLTSDSQVSSDSGADVDPVLSSQKQLVLNAASGAGSNHTAQGSGGGTGGTAWESSSLRQRNVSGSSFRPGIHQPMEPAGWGDPYVKVAKSSGELIAPDSLSIARSTPNLNESAGFAGSHQTWSSTGYISMPSSEELSSNPSPVPKEILNPTSYCIVGVTSGVSPSRSGSEEEAMSLTRPELDAMGKSTTNPYVSLASFEPKSKDNTKRALDALRVFNDLNFGKPTLQHLDVKTSTPTRPYVQTGSIETTRKSQHQPNFFAQACLAEELSSKLSPQIPESKPYVTVASLTETRKLPPPMSSTTSMISSPMPLPLPVKLSNDHLQQQSSLASKGYIPVSSFMAESKPMLVPTCLDTTACKESQRDMSCTTASTIPSFGLNMVQTTLDQEQPKTKNSSGYVSLPDQKTGPWSGKPQPVAKSDEQYSKVTVVPRTAH